MKNAPASSECWAARNQKKKTDRNAHSKADLPVYLRDNLPRLGLHAQNRVDAREVYKQCHSSTEERHLLAGSVVGISNKNEHCNPKRYMMTNQRSNQDADAIVILRMKKAAWIDNEQFKSSIGTDQMKKMQSRWARWSNQQVAPKCISNEREPDMATITLVFQQDNAPPKDKEGLQVTIKKLD
ncbi:hypothetical protein L3Y34_011145 [Caenorhabditis briggsae]|uniref:Uncharacterized protein n=1 Tax=Caenorhabditis briggsae TaxID=6238 RepID=A0AAE9CU36_CAEBR|nr:hypothetical protein L3Y34_011145 [Caenorhabditis briggsae]